MVGGWGVCGHRTRPNSLLFVEMIRVRGGERKVSQEKKGQGRRLEPRRYPSAYEKVVPVVLIILAAGVVILMLVIFAVALGFFPGS